MRQSRRTARSVVPLACALITITGSAAAQPPKQTQPEPAPPAANAEEQNAEGAASVEFVKCKGLDVAETERLLRVELAVIAARVERARAPSVRIECKRDVLHIEVKDPASGGMKALTLPAPRLNTPDRERTVALAASQLFLSSWLEMITREPQPKPSAPEAKPAPAPAPAPARDLGVQTAEYRYGPAGWELWTSGTVNFRHVGNAVRTLSPSLMLRRRFQERLLLEGKLGWETADSARATGTIDWFAGTAGAALGVRAGSPPAFVDALVSSSVLLVRAAGDPNVSGVRGTERDAAAFQVALHVAPSLAISRFRVGLIGQIGFVTPHVTARSPRDEPAYFDGAWAGAGLAVGGELAQ
jgi:hypothetical protein